VFLDIYAQLGAAFMVLVCAFAFLKGDAAERTGAGTYITAWFATTVLLRDNSMIGALPIISIVDMVVLVVFAGLTWRYRRTWPTWACAFQLLAVMAQIGLVIGLVKSAGPAYAVMNIASYAILAAIAVGTFWAWQDRRAAGLK
jgi:hypothetical protein